MRHVERQGRVPLLEPIVQRWRPSKSVNQPTERADAPSEATNEEKTMGSHVNSRLDVVSAA
ncbi:hypothetical protein N7530_000003 [Penicillium desertorum]|uniref:Uncharacterized protein n=1 Tax=Penicillium desertorum TaxID=1303715 RepID=A0A9W9X753_9EURO|nr:hypothetical protein N7530_000003 [Penicillium desertorum]